MVKGIPGPGASKETETAVTIENSTSHAGGGVLTTPSMIGLMEAASRLLMDQYLEEGEASVGYHVDVKHLAAAPVGSKVKVRSTLREMDERKAIFDVEALGEDGRTVGKGMHERRIVHTSRFGRAT